MKSADNWIRLDVNSFREAEIGSVGEARTERSLSPYDIPEAVRSRVQSADESFVIDFRYLTSEPTILVGPLNSQVR
jgi:hypothetical protein